MKFLTFWFDPISPYAYLAFERLPEALAGISHAVEYRPVLFAGLLQHFGHKGPAEIAPKRLWTYRDVTWRAHMQGTALALPQRHPFNPLPLLRLALACAAAGETPNRRVVEAVMRHAWVGGADAEDPARLAELERSLSPVRDPRGPQVKDELRAWTLRAAQEGVFGVPTFEVDGRHFWGDDALPMLAAALRGDTFFDSAAWQAAGAPREGVQRVPPPAA
jgi:2-hydroxychromene-2-carboxylate isomerase